MKALAKKEDKYQVHIMDSGHNLWDRKQEDTYLKVIEIQLQFMLQNLVYSQLFNVG